MIASGCNSVFITVTGSVAGSCGQLSCAVCLVSSTSAVSYVWV